MSESKKIVDLYYKTFGLDATTKDKEALKNEKLHNLYSKPERETGLNVPHTDVYIENAVHEADTLFLPDDDGFKYALVVVDLSTGKTDAEPLQTKEADEALKAIKTIYKRKVLKMPTTMIQVDSGSEFKSSFAKYFKDNNIIVKVTKAGRHRQQAMVEHRNGIIGEVLHKRMTAQELNTGEASREWVEFLPAVIKSVNKKYGHKNKDDMFNTAHCSGKSCELLNVGDKVRIILDEPRSATLENKKLHGKFRKSDIRWEINTRTISQVLLRPNQPPMYLVDGIDNTAYTRNQLQLVSNEEKNPPASIQRKHIVEKLLQKKKIKNRINYLVKWKGTTAQTWEPRTNLIKDVPEMVKEFDSKKK